MHVACIHTHLISGASAVNLIPRPEDWTRLHIDRSQAPPSSLSLFFAGMLGGACEQFSRNYLSSCMTSMPCFLFCPGLTQPVFFALLFQWHSVLSGLTLFLFQAPLLFVGYFAGHFENTVVPYLRPPKLHFMNFHINYPLDLL